jgi:hypothetical protein
MDCRVKPGNDNSERRKFAEKCRNHAAASREREFA